jgi:hypothetical protein
VSAARGEPGPRSRAFVRWLLHRGAWIWAAALALAVPATWRTAQLYTHLRSELEQLLPRNAPSVIAINELRARVAGLQHLGVVVDTGSAENLKAGERLLDDLAIRVRAYPRGMVRAARTGDADERRFLEDHAPLYMDVADLEAVKQRLEARRDWEASKEQGALLDEGPAPPLDFDDIQKKYDDRTASSHRFEDDHFANREQHAALLLIEVGEFDTGRARGEALLQRVKADLAALDPGSYAPGLRVGFTSDVAINTEETQALVADLTLSSIVVIVVVVAVIILYFEWWRSIVILLPPLLLATVYSFALASLWPLEITELNSNTAFLGSIIVGNGINFGIVLLARHVEERRGSVAVQEALVRAVWGARTGTLSAALAAGVSYTSLALTDFRGFRQFGFIGGIGMVFSWLLAFVLMPPLAAWVDRGVRLAPQRRSLMKGVVALVKGYPRAVVVVATLLAIGAGWEVRSFGPDQIETDFSKLRRADTWKTGEGYWGRKMDALLGSYVTPTVLLADSAEQARAIGHELRTQEKLPPLDHMIASVRTLEDVVPVDQDRKIALAEDIRDDLTPKIRAQLTPDQRKIVDRLLGKGPLGAVTAGDLPETFTTGLRERDGSLGRAVLVYPKPGHLLWEGPPLAEFVARLRAAAATGVAPGGRPARVAGSLALSNDILESVRRDGLLANSAALGGVVLVVVLLLRASRATLLVIASLLLGVLWLGGAMMASHVKINFANFIAYPITFGIGVDYSVNMISRWELDGRGSMMDVVRTTGGAVTLCSMTTIVGYSSLLLAENRALFLFGLLAVLGEVACLSTAVVVLPACLELLRRPARTA